MKLCPVALLCLALSVFASAQEATPPAPPNLLAEASATPALDLIPGSDGKLSQEQLQGLIRVAAQNYRANYKKLRDYTFTERDVEHKLDGKGNVKSTESKTYELMQLYGEPVNRLIEKDDKPLSAQDAAKEDERIQKLTDKRKNESEQERKRREAEEEKRHEKGREFVSEVADAYNFDLIDSEIVNGRDAWVIAAEPKPGFQAHLKEAEMLSKIHGRLWIDKQEMQLAKIDIAVLDTLSFGWILARIHPGTRFVYECTKINDEVWLPLRYQALLDARIALFRKDSEQDEGSYRDYKKFRTSSKIVSVGEVREQK